MTLKWIAQRLRMGQLDLRLQPDQRPQSEKTYPGWSKLVRVIGISALFPCADKTRLIQKLEAMNKRHIIGIGMPCGIGYTEAHSSTGAASPMQQARSLSPSPWCVLMLLRPRTGALRPCSPSCGLVSKSEPFREKQPVQIKSMRMALHPSWWRASRTFLAWKQHRSPNRIPFYWSLPSRSPEMPLHPAENAPLSREQIRDWCILPLVDAGDRAPLPPAS